MTTAQGWVVDRQYAAAVTVMLVLSYFWVIMPTGLQWQNVLEGGESTGVGPWFKVQWMPLFALALWIMLQRGLVTANLARHLNPFMLLLSGWMFCTALWAPDPGLVVRQTIIIIGVEVMAIAHVVAGWQPRRLEDLLRWTLTVLGLLSLVVALALPQIGVHQNSEQFELNNSWRGIGTTKYFLGHVAEFSAILWFIAWASGRVSGRAAALAVLFSIFLLFKSRCNTSMLVLAIGMTVSYFLLRPPIHLKKGEAGMLFAGLAILFLLPFLVYMWVVGEVTYAGLMKPVAGFFGKDITISGRTPIWEQVWLSITSSTQNFWLGVGYMNFWNGPGSLADGAYKAIKWRAPDGHNGFIDIWNELGLVGLIIVIAFMAFHFRQLRQVARIDHLSYVVHLAIFLMTFIENLTASGYFRPIWPPFLLIVLSSAALSRVLLEHEWKIAAARSQQAMWQLAEATRLEQPLAVASVGSPSPRPAAAANDDGSSTASTAQPASARSTGRALPWPPKAGG